MASTDQWPMYFLTTETTRAGNIPGGRSAVLVVACPDCKALVADLDLGEHRSKAHGGS